MGDKRKSIFSWNHISNELSVENIEELKSYYRTYHKKSWAYKQAMKRFKKLKLLGNSASIIFASGGIASAAASGGIALVGIAAVSLLIKWKSPLKPQTRFGSINRIRSKSLQ